MASNYAIKTPHAAVLVWNYIDRIGTEGMDDDPQSSGVDDLTGVEPTIISTLSCISIETSKSKGQPEGSFRIVLAPTKDWVSTLTAGSWLAILMSNDPITQHDLKKANKSQVKMIGKIESVRTEVNVGDDGARQTRFYVAGVDWGHIFNNIIYVDNLIASGDDPKSQGNAIAVALRNLLFGNDGTPKSFNVDDNLIALIGLFGKSASGLQKAGTDINRLAASLYSFNMPKEMVQFFSFVDSDGDPTTSVRINDNLSLVSGKLIDDDTYQPTNEAKGYIDPFTLQGQHTFWQVLMDNSNPVLNEMYPEMDWVGDADGNNSLALTVYNRIKPFSFRGFVAKGGAGAGPISYFQYVKRHDIDPVTVMSINAGTNWRDKFNFIEVKPNFQDFNVIANWYKQKSQAFDSVAFEREGFRPLILETKQFPSATNKLGGNTTDINVDWDQLQKWVLLLRDWYFNTHRMLNGTLVMYGTTNYIAVGDNIRMDAGLISPTPNLTVDIANYASNDDWYVLAQVESINHSFTVGQDGARSYVTTIQFVRGIIVNGKNVAVGDGPLDKLADGVTQDHRETNTQNVISSSDKSDPDGTKLAGT